MIDVIIAFGVGFILGGFAGICLTALVAISGDKDE